MSGSSISAGEIADFREVRPLVVGDGAEGSFEVCELLLDLRVLKFVFFAGEGLAGFPIGRMGWSVNCEVLGGGIDK